MKIMIMGGAGFIGTNLVLKLSSIKENEVYSVDKNISYFSKSLLEKDNVKIIESSLDCNMDFKIIEGMDVVYHLVSSNVPTTSNQHISNDIESNVVFSAKLFDSCVKYNVKKVIFISSGGTVYGKELECPLSENCSTNPISSYGLQKVFIEKMLYLYKYIYNLDYRIVRLANPYGPYQRPNGILGAVTTFTYKALKGEDIIVYGDGKVIRDYIYIDDAVNCIINISNYHGEERIFNVGCGYGISVSQLLNIIQKTLNKKLSIRYVEGRKVDVPKNYLDISKYKKNFKDFKPICLEEGIKKTAEFLMKEYLHD